MYSKRIVLGIICGFLLSLTFLYLKKSYSPTISLPSIFRQSSTPTPIKFHELTIPYLRNRTYVSSLGPLEEISESQNFTSYKTSYNSDGLKIYGLLTQPKGAPPEGGWPAIIFIHGYIPPTLYKTTSNYVAYVNYLARQGFVVFKIDLRGHGQSEGEPGGAYYSSDYIIDTLNAKEALRTSSFVNPEKIGLWGHSMAGNVSFRSFVVSRDIPALVIWAGAGYTYEDLLTYRISDSSYRPPSISSTRQQRRQQLFDIHGEFDPSNIFWKQVVPINYLDDVTGAIQLHHATNDQVVSIQYSRNLIKKLDGSSSISHELYEYPAGGHNIEGVYFNQAMERTVSFFKKYLN